MLTFGGKQPKRKTTKAMRKTLETPFRILAKPKEKYICRLQMTICRLQTTIFNLQICIFSLQMENDSHSANFSRLLSTLFDGTFLFCPASTGRTPCARTNKKRRIYPPARVSPPFPIDWTWLNPSSALSFGWHSGRWPGFPKRNGCHPKSPIEFPCLYRWTE